MVSSQNIDPKNVSAFMVHHVLQKQHATMKTRKKRPRKMKKIRELLTKQQDPNSSTIPLSNMNKQEVKTSSLVKTLTPKTAKKKSNPKSLSPSNTREEKDRCSTLFENHFRTKTLFEWVLNPITVENFMNNHWEKKPLLISKNRNEFSHLISTPGIDDLLTSADIHFTKNVDITIYSNGVKELHNPEGRARPHVVWDFYCNGCSVRMLNPQTFVPNIHKLTSELQEYFGCFVGCNAYLTPPHSQGFAPHFDDIEAFILQIEGKKHWLVYEPRSPNEVLSRFSSPDFVSSDLGEPILDVVLNAGDVLYLPRGYIHQATTEQDYHSLHITLSAYQCNAWIDLLQKVVPKALEDAWQKDVEFREGLPLDYLHAAGLTRNRKYKKTREMMENKVKCLIRKLCDHIRIDPAVDQLAAKFLYDALPNVLTEEEKQCSVFGGGLRMIGNGHIVGATEFEFDEKIEIALLRKFVSRLVKEVNEDPVKKKKKIVYKLYYTTDNSLEYHAEKTSFSLVPKAFVPCVQYLFQSYPNYVTIQELPHDDLEEKINLVADLWERGIIRSKDPILKLKQ